MNDQISIQKDVSQNESWSGKIKKVDVENKMSHTWCPVEPKNSTQSALFRGVMALYFASFFFEHPV